MINVWLFSLLMLQSSLQEGRVNWSEDDWNTEWCESRGGVREYRLPSLQRVDCLDRELGIAWEMDWGAKHYECFGQALGYARQTGLAPGCVLIIKRDRDCKYLDELKAQSSYWRVSMAIANIGVQCE